ncbi:unnamed protein product [Arabidopsis thaliana]|uniref:E3 ubiquitin-protein ligase RMA n=1 Tax=Arabidopsis thaliana TaxID=3702 RepID=A0A7G2F170_ARATH|nr:unnamed protein product [Arabidopsis thaliana]
MALDQSFEDAALLGELYGEDSVQEPVVTLCGHLFCWPCIHKWLDRPLYYSGRSPQEGYYPVSGVMSSNSLSYSAVLDPVMVMVGEMVATRLFGTRVMDRFAYPDTYNLAGTSGPRMRRRIMQADKSLGRIFFFFMCCVVLCLLLF